MRVTVKLVLFILSLNSALSFAKPIHTSGRFVLWQRQKCLRSDVACPLPEGLGIEWPFSVELKREDKSGVEQRRAKFMKDSWVLYVDSFAVKAEGEGKSYISFQYRLEHLEQGLVLECSRYDHWDTLKWMPAGACTGVVGDRQIGVSYYPEAK